jgi:hypothetical protein
VLAKSQRLVNGRRLATCTKSAFQNPNGVVSASRERPTFGEYFCVWAVYSSALDAYSKVLKRALRRVYEGGERDMGTNNLIYILVVVILVVVAILLLQRLL